MLDRFVYDPSQPSEGLGVTLAKGVFRFTTGSLKKSAYTVTTPTAVIGVRGTVFDADVNAHRTRVTLREGGALVCPRKKGITFEQQARKCEKGHSSHCDCADLTVVGQTAQVSKDASNAVLVPTPVQFANFCSGALCSAENYASLSNPGLSNFGFPGSGTPSTVGAPITSPIVKPSCYCAGSRARRNSRRERRSEPTWFSQPLRNGVFCRREFAATPSLVGTACPGRAETHASGEANPARTGGRPATVQFVGIATARG